MRTVALIQARTSSSRLPGKVLAPLGGKPMIVWMAERVLQARTLDAVMIVTSVDPSDDKLAEVARASGLSVYRGSLDDVLDRYMQAAAEANADVIVRLTGDCPLSDPFIIDSVVDTLMATGADYASNVDPPCYADGFDVECFSREALERTHREAITKVEREHVTVWMRSDAANLRRVNVAGPIDTSHLRLTVDYPDDLEVVRRLASILGDASTDFDLYDVLRCLHRNPELVELNRHARNEGLQA